MLDIFSTLIAPPLVAVDVGTATTRLYASASDTLTEQPSTLSLRGAQAVDVADEYLRHTNRQLTSRPLRGGVVVDVRNAVSLLRPLLRQARQRFLQPISLASAPSDTTPLERARLQEALLQAGAKKVYIIPEVLAAALGAGLDIEQGQAQLLVDIGDGVTDMAVLRHGRIVAATSIRLACSDLQRAVRSSLITLHRVRVSDSAAERLTHCLKALLPEDDGGETVQLEALDIGARRQRLCQVSRRDLAQAMEPLLTRITATISAGVRRLPAEMRREIAAAPLCLTGGGALISGMDGLIAAGTGLQVRVADDPLHAVINGAIHTLRSRHGDKQWWDHIDWPTFSA